MAQRYQGTSNRKRANRRATQEIITARREGWGKEAQVLFENVIRPAHLLRNPLEVEVARSPKRTSLGRKGKEK